MEGIASYWVVVGLLVAIVFAVFVLKPKGSRMRRRRRSFDRREVARLLVPPVVISIFVGLVVTVYIVVKTSR